MQNNEQSIIEAMRLAQSPAGQQLINMLKTSNAEALEQAVKNASAGNYSQAQQILSALLKDPEAQKLLGQLGR